MAATKVILIQTAFLGDLLLSVPLMKTIRQYFSNAEITLVCRQGIGSVFVELGLVEKYYEINKGDRKSYRKVQEALAHENYDWLLSPHESVTTALFISGLKAKNKISFQQWWNFPFFTERIKKQKNLPEALRQLSLLEKHIPHLKENLYQYVKSGDQTVPAWASPVVQYPFKGRSVSDKSICLFPGSVWATKKWTEEGFIDVGRDFLQRGYQVLVMGGPGEEKIAERVCSGIGIDQSRVQNWAGKTSLLQTLEIIRQSKLVVTNDSAGQHLAALVETPTVTVFGPTVLEFGYRAWNNKSVVVENKSLSCRPCGKHGHHQCPIGTHECMKSISSQQVISAAAKLQSL